VSSGGLRIYNKIEDNFHLSNKKALFYNMTSYYKAIGKDPFHGIPVTFHIVNGVNDPEFDRFKVFYQKLDSDIINFEKN
jgi:hypothetical protein